MEKELIRIWENEQEGTSNCSKELIIDGWLPQVMTTVSLHPFLYSFLNIPEKKGWKGWVKGREETNEEEIYLFIYILLLLLLSLLLLLVLLLIKPGWMILINQIFFLNTTPRNTSNYPSYYFNLQMLYIINVYYQWNVN